MEHPLVSIIVPVYKAEMFLNQCADSLLGQTYRNVEVILVDDASPDRCPEICEEYAQNDERVRVIHKVNGGVSAARNTGLDAANGEYIVFVDADDYLDTAIIEKAVDCVESSPLLYLWGYTILDRQSEKPGPHLAAPESMSVAEMQSLLIGRTQENVELGNYFRAVWGKLFLADVIREHRIRFPEDLYIGEDAVFLLDYVRHVNGVAVVSDTGYFYRTSESSAVQRYKTDLLEQSERQIQAVAEKADCADPRIRSAVVVLCYECFRALVQNERKAAQPGRKNTSPDSKVWFRRHRELMRQKNVDTSGMRKLYQLQHRISSWCPYWVHRLLVKILD